MAKLRTRKLFFISLAIVLGGTLADVITTYVSLSIPFVNGVGLIERNPVYYSLGGFGFSIYFALWTAGICFGLFVAEFASHVFLHKFQSIVKYALFSVAWLYGLYHLYFGISNIIEIAKFFSIR